MAHFIPCLATDTAPVLSRRFIQNIFRLHGLPSDIVSDRGSLFTSNFFSEIRKQLKIKQNLSAAYRPQTDGQTERLNQMLEQYLRMYTNFLQTDWVYLLALAEFAYNNAWQASIKQSTFFANYGYHARFEATMVDGHTPAAQEHAELLSQVHEQCKINMAKAQESYKYYADAMLKDAPSFQVVDQVRLKRTNIRSSRPSGKLDHLFIGPLRILEKIGILAYKLDLPPTMRIHNVIHVSLLEPYHSNNRGTRAPSPTSAPDIDESGVHHFVVDAILHSRVVRGNVEYLVHWKGYESSENSWVPCTEFLPDDEVILAFHRKFPRKPMTQAVLDVLQA